MKIVTKGLGLVLAIALFPALSLASPQVDAVSDGPQNWSAPPYWSPPAVPLAVEEDGRSALAAGRQPLTASPVAMPFVAVTPCRVVDTRAGSGFTGAYGQPALQGQATRTFVIGGQCGIPNSAQAVSFLFTAVNMTADGSFRVFPLGAPLPTVGGAVRRLGGHHTGSRNRRSRRYGRGRAPGSERQFERRSG